MTDRELLELAAKAAGLPELRGAGSQHHCYYILDEQPTKWNPLTDDGDALRLACKLALVVYCDNVEAWCEWGELNENLEFEHNISADPEYRGAESVRRAIVLAAAEIGRAAK